ncbi:MAG TPA: dihydroorotate dehydrogenase [Solirubrobacterales bacterium]|jgi:dihydroorotate dehydrogenase (NAD+) catalytic subunit|nr:dihydroorotate dehydrogenase [Solirubrobacterales bacterium]
MAAPFGRRLCEVGAARASGGYRVFSLLDRDGPEPLPGQFYMLTAASGWAGAGQRPFLPRAISVAEFGPAAEGVRLDFLVEGIGPGTDRLCALEPGEHVWVAGPLGNAFSTPRDLSPGAAGAILVGGGIGVAPLALLRRRFSERGIPLRVLLGFRNEDHSGGLDLFCGAGAELCPEVRLSSEDGHAGYRGYVTDLLNLMLEGDDAQSAAVYSCGPPAMLDAVAALCDSRDVACELAMEAPMACGFGACFGCAIPKPEGGYHRLCVDGPVMRSSAGGVVVGVPRGAEAVLPPSTVGDTTTTGPAAGASPSLDFCGIELQHPVINASGTYDAIAAHKVFGDDLLAEFPFAAFVSKTITPEPRAGNAPQRIWETPAGMINSIGLPNKGLEGFLAEDLPRLAELPVPLIVSVMATNREEFSRLVGAVAARDEVAAIELNVSCPNVHSGLIVGEQPGETEALLETLRPLTAKPLIVKLTPNVADPAAVAVGAERGGADAVSLINTLKASAIDPLSGAPALAAGHGGLSGPAVRPVALQQLRAVTAATALPAIGMGGVSSGADAGEFLASGATLVAVGTENFRDPRAGSRVVAELGERPSRRPEAASVLNLQ